MNTQTETISPVKVQLEQLARVCKWGGNSAPSIFFFGEYEFPLKTVIASNKNITKPEYLYYCSGFIILILI